MRKTFAIALVAAAAAIVAVVAHQPQTVAAEGKPGAGFAAIPGSKGGQDMFGAYDIVKGWPQNISTIPGNEKWTFGAGQGVYAENPNRVFMLFRGELPVVPRRRRNCSPSSARAFSSPSVVCHFVTLLFRLSPEQVERAKNLTMVPKVAEGHRGRGRQVGKLHSGRRRQWQHH